MNVWKWIVRCYYYLYEYFHKGNGEKWKQIIHVWSKWKVWKERFERWAQTSFYSSKKNVWRYEITEQNSRDGDYLQNISHGGIYTLKIIWSRILKYNRVKCEITSYLKLYLNRAIMKTLHFRAWALYRIVLLYKGGLLNLNHM